MTTKIITFSPKEIETRRRIKLSVWAFAYEFRAHSIVTDAIFDVESYLVDLSVETNRLDLDYWFRAFFQPHTGMWIHKHPELSKIEKLYEEHYHDRENLRELRRAHVPGVYIDRASTIQN